MSGDHGPRDTPNPSFSDEFPVDERCKNATWGAESLYVASAVITYLGKEPEVLKYFDGHENKVFNGPCDH